MPTNYQRSTRQRQADGTVVTTTYRQGTRRRRSRWGRWYLGDKNVRSTTVITRHPDGTVEKVTGRLISRGWLLLIPVFLVGLIIVAVEGSGNGTGNANGGQPNVVAGPPAPPSAYSTLLYSLDWTGTGAQAGNYGPIDNQVTVGSGPIVACYVDTSNPAGPGNMEDSITLDPGYYSSEFTITSVGQACTALVSAAEVSTDVANGGRTMDIEIFTMGTHFLLDVWQAAAA